MQIRRGSWILTFVVPLVLTGGPSPGGADAVEDAVPGFADGLSGRDIYERVLENRFESYEQVSELLSGDRGGSEQGSRLTMAWQDFRDAEREAVRGVESKTMVRYTHPQELRYSGYLIINNDERASDQFVYLASRRRVRRVNLRGEAIFGTDFSFEDVVPRELDEATYRRLPDEPVDGIPCYVVEATPLPENKSEYSRFVTYVEKDRYVPLRTRYWSDAGVEVKRLEVDPAAIEQHADVHVPMRMTMRHLLHESHTRLVVTELEPNPDFSQSRFDLRRLEGH